MRVIGASTEARPCICSITSFMVPSRTLCDSRIRSVSVETKPPMDEASRCDRLLLLRDGRSLSASTLAALLERTGTAHAEQAERALIDAADAADGRDGGAAA